MVKKDQMGNCERWISTVDGMNDRVLEGRKVWGTMAKLRKENMISKEVKREINKE